MSAKRQSAESEISLTRIDEVTGYSPVEQSDIQAVQSCCGPPLYPTRGGQILKEHFWAELRRRETTMSYSPEENRFYQYSATSGLYEEITEHKLKEEIAQRIYESARHWVGAEALEKLRNRYHLTGVVSALKGKAETKEAFKDPGDIIACRNCVVRFDEGKRIIEGFSPRHYFRHKSPYDYDPKAKCPLFHDYLLSHVDDDNRLVFQKLAGQVLLGRNLIQRIGILDGHGSASKTALINTIAGILGSHRCAELRTEHLDSRFEIANISHASLLIGPDVTGNFLCLPGARRLKSLVGGDLLSCEFKNSKSISNIVGEFNILISSNAQLRLWIDSDCAAWKRRLIIIRYERPFRTDRPRIPEIHEKLLEEEGSGILNWCLKGAELLLEDIAGYGDIRLSERQEAWIERLLGESNSLATFLRDKIQNTGRGGAGLSSEEIIERYLQYCTKRTWRPIKITQVVRELPDLMGPIFGITKGPNVVRKKKRVNGYLRVGWMPDIQEPA